MSNLAGPWASDIYVGARHNVRLGVSGVDWTPGSMDHCIYFLIVKGSLYILSLYFYVKNYHSVENKNHMHKSVDLLLSK